MKQINTVFALALAVLVSSCSDRTDPLPDGTDRIALSGTIDTRAPGDPVPFKLYAANSSGPQWEEFLVKDADARLTATGISLAVPYFWPSGSTTYRFFGFMNPGDTSSPSFNADNDGVLTVVAGEGENHDFLMSNNLVANETSPSKKMLFRHLMSQLKVKVDVKPSVTGTHLIAVNIAAGKTTGTYSVFDDNTVKTVNGTASTGYTASMAVTTAAGGADDTEKIFYLVPDGSEITSVSLVSVDGVVIGEDMPIKKTAAKNITLEAGESYELTINVDSPEAASVTVKPVEWEEEWLADQYAGENGSDGDPLVLPLDHALFPDATHIEFMDSRGIFFDSDITAGEVVLTSEPAGPLSSIKVSVGTDVHTLPDGYMTFSTEGMAIRDGDGTSAASARLVKSKADFIAISSALDGHYVQTITIDLENNEWTPFASFTGSFDGQCQGISNLKITGTANDNALFSQNSGSLKNIVLVSGSVSGTDKVASLCAVNTGTVYGCVNEGVRVSGKTNVAGLVANASGDGSRVENCVNKAEVLFAGNHGGGLIAYAHTRSAVLNCVNTGRLASSDGGEAAGTAAGIVGRANGNVLVKRCFNSGEIRVGDSASAAAGNVAGVVGSLENTSEVTECFNAGPVFGNISVGGIAGQATSQSKITSCYVTGNVSGKSNIGGAVGSTTSSGAVQMTALYNKRGAVESTVASGAGQIGGVIGYNQTSNTAKALFNIAGAVTTGGPANHVGGVFGRQRATAENCFMGSGVIADPSPAVKVFSAADWPKPAEAGWEPAPAGPWASLGSFAGGVYPQLSWEDEARKEWGDLINFD